MQQVFNPTQLDSYNKHPVGHGTLVANWFEEDVLRKANGEGRSHHNFHYPKKHEKLMLSEPEEVTKMVAGLHHENTTLRTMGPGLKPEFKSENHTYGKGVNKADLIPKVGRRQELEEKKFFQTVGAQLMKTRSSVAQMENNRQFKTTTGEQFVKPEKIMENTVGRRRMVNQDGLPIPFANKDEELLTAHGFYERRQITDDQTLKKMLPLDQPYSVQQPVTFWLEKLPEGNVYNSKAQARKAQFRRNNDFLKSFHDYTHQKL